MMKFFILFISVLFSLNVLAQNIILADGEYIDTTSNLDVKCKDYNMYYYSVGGKYPKSSATVLKDVQSFLVKNNNTYSGSGYITFRFKIDCEGKQMQKVQVLQTDQKYLKHQFDKKLVDELFIFLRTLSQWKIATMEGKAYLYRAFITFKIKNGKVINIIP
jgi:hypothetical protein